MDNKRVEYIKTFGDFYDEMIISCGLYYLKKGDKLINFDKHEMNIVFEAWEEYATIGRIEIACNIAFQALKCYYDDMKKDKT